MTYISPQFATQTAGAIGQANLADTAGVRIRGDAGSQSPLFDGGGRTVHFYSRHKTEIRAENQRTLEVIKDVVGSRLGQAGLRRFEATLSAGVKRGDKPLTMRQLQSAIRPELIESTGFAGFKALGDEMPRVVGFSRLVRD
ncbi:MAG: hypothetical protein LBI62_08155 [Candidatus Accumulibacter sp.]|jgi:hypothetical protein|nr:hypothetical protein [Accumulibacter sp.]